METVKVFTPQKGRTSKSTVIHNNKKSNTNQNVCVFFFEPVQMELEMERAGVKSKINGQPSYK